MNYSELIERVNTVSDSCGYLFNSGQPDEYTVSQFEMVSLLVTREDNTQVYYNIHKHRLVALGIPCNAGYCGYISSETVSHPGEYWRHSKHRAKLYQDNAAFERALKRIANMNPTLIK